MTSKTRNIIGSILCFISCCLAGGIAFAFWMVREVRQSEDGGFEIEKDDILRYSLIGAVGYIFNITWIVIECNHWWLESV